MRLLGLTLVAALVATGCDSDDDAGTNADAGTTDTDAGKQDGGRGPIDTPATYTFVSRFTDESSVDYGGQTKRHLLVESLKSYLGDLDDQTFANPQPGDVIDALRFYLDFETVGFPEQKISVTTHLPLAQLTFGELGGLSGLREKLPDVDNAWRDGVIGYGDGTMLPSAVVEDLFAQVEGLVLERFAGEIPRSPDGNAIAAPYLSGDGVDYQQLTQKFLAGAIFYSQGADDYLDDDLEGKGLNSDNTAAVVSGDSTQPYTALEHAWDEGFGYFGAARNYGDYTDGEVAGDQGRTDWLGAHDTNQDGQIDVRSEIVLGHAQNASKRDYRAPVAVDFSGDAFSAFLEGRALIVNAGGALDPTQMTALKAHRDQVLKAWESALSATVVHYINEVLQDMATFDTADYSFVDHAKHWSELKGFALALQFNPNHGSWSKADLQTLHTHLGHAPALPVNDVAAYQQALLDARALVGRVQGFDAANLGDDDGLNGW